MKLKKGDNVQIITGNDRGKTGKILSVAPASGLIVVEGMNMKKKHVRPRRQDQKGEMVRLPKPFPASRSMLVCASCGKPTRIGTAVSEGRRTRICKKCGAGV